MRDFMMKVQLLLTLCSLSQAAYMSRMTNINRIRSPAVFRPGVTLHRPWMHQRLVQASSNRAPYVLYRNAPQRFAVKHYQPARHVFNTPWKTTRVPLSPTPQEYEFIRAATQQIVHTDGGTAGAIHTIPAPNLSLSEKPIVVLDASESNPASEAPKPTYEVTEKHQEPMYQMAKIETPVGFSKTVSMNSPELQTLIRNGAALQYASEFGLSAISLPPNHIVQQPPQVHQIQQAPQQFAIQGFNNIPSQQELINSGAEGIVIPPNALYQSDPMFLQKLQAQLLQRFPAVEFIPYAADSPPVQMPPNQPQQPQLLLLENEELKPEPSSFVPNIPHKNIVQRETQENSIVTLIPQAFVMNNVSDKPETTSSQPQNITLELVAAESQPITTTIKYVIESNTEEQNTTPVYYAQVGQSVGDVIAKGFYSAINDVRTAALAQVENPRETKIDEKIATTAPELKKYFIKGENEVKNETITELKPILGVPFAKPADRVNVTYTLVKDRSDGKPKMTQEGTVYAGQIVEATISEDHDFNKAKATLLSRRAPIRLVAVSEQNDIATDASSGIVPQIDVPTNSGPKLAVVKAKIPPKSKLIFDDKTGEPVLRIYASYVDSPAQKELIATKLANLRRVKEVTTKKESVDNWKAATVKSVDKNSGL
ncbi:uncharacterized protein LOC115440669 [Manduca sexta]|uniref:uncharacterized protein LOC115440669 n=1 Tax=Manduca sexta TaxID=7130 RepID=UPI00188EC584|nr:uncharacterized protein LOC115440669 [Manduca sexta]